ncbi:MAG TPA: helix-turn-helix domain-containing protein [Chloroflexota bacterium]|nr:helix-turn-helix domain-containing protein [Chloroflexota bacterium]
MAEVDSSEPAPRREIHDLGALRIMADPLRARLVRILRQSAATAKDVAALIGTSPKSLYYHLGLLEQHGLIRVVETRLVSGITEKRYRATAYLFTYKDLEPGEGETPLQGLEIAAGSYFSITAEEVRESIREGRLLPEGSGAPPERTLQLGWHLPRLRPEEAITLGQRLHNLLHEYESLGEGAPNAGCETYRVLYALFPTHPRRDPPET